MNDQVASGNDPARTSPGMAPALGKGNDDQGEAGIYLSSGGTASGTAPGIQNEPEDFLMTLDPNDRLDIQCVCDRFDAFWKGRTALRSWKDDQGAGKREEIYKKITWPRKVRPGPLERDARPGGPGWPWRKPVVKRRGGAVEDTQQRRDSLAAIQAGEFGIVPLLSPLGLKLVKVLGKGGFGCACLFESQDVNGSCYVDLISPCAFPITERNCLCFCGRFLELPPPLE